MKIAQHTNVEEVIGVQKQHKFKITDQSQAIIMDSLINLYSDPIGSIVREITSNCIDANRERDLKVDGKIPKEEGDSQLFWSSKQTVCIEYVEKNTILGIDECIMFHDHGCGLSEERVANVFTTFGASTKRDNNYEIGGFGLGAKSPLAYTETFYVSSRHNGTETYFMLYRNNDNVPHMDQVYQTSTEEKNGSTVIVPIQDHYDKNKFRDAISEQLCFFDNIVFKNVIESLGSVTQYYAKDSSRRVVIETEDYVLTNNGKSVDLLVGKVVYPLNWDQLESEEGKYNASMCIKFDIGVLDLVPSRESIRYTPKTIAAIDGKLKAVRAAFVKDVGEQYAEEVNYLAFIKSIGNISQSSRWSSLTSNDPLAIKASMVNVKMTDIPFVPIPSISPTGTTGAGAFHKVFDGIHFYKIGFAKNSKAIGGLTLSRTEYTSYEELARGLGDHTKIFHVENNFSTAKDAALLANDVSFIGFKADKDKLGARVANVKGNLGDSRPDWQKTTTFNAVLKQLKASDMYSDYEAVEEIDVEEEFGSVLDNKSRRKINKEVFVRTAEFKADGYVTKVSYSNQEYKISNLQDLLHPVSENTTPTLKAVVYSETKDVDELEKVVKIVGSSRDSYDSGYNYSYSFKSDYRILKVSKDVAKQFAKLDGFITAHEFMKSSTHLQRFATTQYINKFLEEFKFLRWFSDYDKDLFHIFNDLDSYHTKNTNSCWRCESDIDPIVQEIMKLDIPDTVRYDMELVDKLEEAVEYSRGLDLLNHVDFTSDSRESILEFLSLKDKLPSNQQSKLILTA